MLATMSAMAQDDPYANIDDLIASHLAVVLHQDSIDQSHLLTVYDYRCQTADADGKPVTDQMQLALQVGTHCTRSYPYWKYREDNEGIDYFDTDELRQILYDESYTFVPEVWTNYPEDNVTVRDAILPNVYETRAKRTPLKWTLTDDTLTVCGYLCHSATTALHGKRWTAYYTEDIPSSAGPWRLCGLPGLILHAEDDGRIHSFTAEMIKKDGASIFYEHNAITNKIPEETLVRQKNKVFGNRLYARNPTYYIDKKVMYNGVDNVIVGFGDKYYSIINGIIEKDKAHKYQPLEVK